MPRACGILGSSPRWNPRQPRRMPERKTARKERRESPRGRFRDRFLCPCQCRCRSQWPSPGLCQKWNLRTHNSHPIHSSNASLESRKSLIIHGLPKPPIFNSISRRQCLPAASRIHRTCLSMCLMECSFRWLQACHPRSRLCTHRIMKIHIHQGLLQMMPACRTSLYSNLPSTMPLS